MMPHSLRRRLPLLLLLFVLIAAGLTLLIALPLQNRTIEERGMQHARSQSDLVQSGLNSVLRQGNLADARTYLGSLMLDSSIRRVLLLDSTARVLLDPSRELDGKPALPALGDALRATQDEVLATNAGRLRLGADRGAVVALYPVILASREFSLRPARNGLLYIEWDLEKPKAAERQFILSVLGSMVAVMAALTVVLGVVMDRAISTPVQQLLRTAQAMASGDRGARAVAHGSSEFVALAQALNSVMASLLEKQRDLTERERQLRLSHEFSGTGTFEWSLKDNAVRGTRHFWSRFFGDYLNNELPLEVGMRVVDPQHRALLDQALNSCAMIGTSLDVHFRCHDREGQWHWLHLVGNAERDEHGCALRIVALARDETVEVAARDALRATTRELEYQKYALDQHSIVAITDVRDVITYVNDKFCQVSGYQREQLLGRTHRMLKSGAHDEDFYHEMWITISAGKVWRGELQNRRQDGSHYWVATTIVPHFDIDGRADGYISILTDITTRVEGERERERLQQQLYQTQKVEALGLLAGGIAHDFNNLLAAILGHTELAQRRFGDHGDGRLATYLSEIMLAAERGRDLVQRVLTFSHGSPEQVSALSLADEIRDSLRMLRPLLPTTITITSDLRNDVPPVALAASQLQQVVMNLCINARDALDGNGQLHVALEFARRHGECAACGNEFDAHFVVLRVEDSGHGISADILARIFDPFFTTKAVGEGSGLGLSVVHGIVHQADGHILVSAFADGGTAFEILFSPCALEGQRAPLASAESRTAARPALEHSA
jgi:PAS domain S-box-containing protein